MLWLIILILIVGWALGIFVFNLTGLIHILLAIALVAFIIALVRGKEVV